MTGVLTCSAKISFGNLTSPWREPAESNRGASRWSASLVGAAVAAFLVVVFLVVVFLVVVLASAIRPSSQSACQRGPSPSEAWSTDARERARLSRPARRP